LNEASDPLVNKRLNRPKSLYSPRYPRDKKLKLEVANNRIENAIHPLKLDLKNILELKRVRKQTQTLGSTTPPARQR
jgi:hypothetical protein